MMHASASSLFEVIDAEEDLEVPSERSNPNLDNGLADDGPKIRLDNPTQRKSVASIGSAREQGDPDNFNLADADNLSSFDSLEDGGGKAKGPRQFPFLLTQHCLFRKVWSVVLAILLLYTGTIYIYRLVFVEFRAGRGNEPLPRNAWNVTDEVVNCLFILDIIFTFLTTFREPRSDVEVTSLRRIALRYLGGCFVIDVLACWPWQAMGSMYGTSGHNSLNRSLRLLRLQRLSRLANLARTRAMIDALTKMGDDSSIMQHMRGHRAIRILNFFGGFLLVIHLFACGWYLCASLHANVEDTWLARRTVDSEGLVTLLTRGPFEQWTNSMYFILTIFTTVGFGDMSAVTVAEIWYVCFTMLAGAVINGVIISHVINIIMRADKADEEALLQEELAEEFSTHVELSSKSKRILTMWMVSNYQARHSHHFDRETMRQMLLDGRINSVLLASLRSEVFGGELVRNRFVRLLGDDDIPVRMPVLLALFLNKRLYHCGDRVYSILDAAISIYLVMDGAFAHVAMPTPSGGVDEADESIAKDHKANKMFPYHIYMKRSYFGLIEIIRDEARKSTVRCESKTGSLLMLTKEDFAKCVHDFPSFGIAWRRAAFRHERRRIALLARLRTGKPLRHLAALRLQRFWRLLRAGARLKQVIHTTSEAHAAMGGTPTNVLARTANTVGELSSPKAQKVLGNGGAEGQATTLSEVKALKAEVASMREDLSAVVALLRANTGAGAGVGGASPGDANGSKTNPEAPRRSL